MKKSVFITLTTLILLFYSSLCFGISVFTVSGTVKNRDGTLAETGIEVQVTNQTRGLTELTTVGKLEKGKYSVTFFDKDEPNSTVAELNDIIEVKVTGFPAKTYQLTADDIAQARAVVDVQESEVSVINIDASPVKLPADGNSQSTITITVKDAYDNPIIDEKLTIETDKGEVTEAEPKGNGKYQAIYTSSEEVGIAKITVTAENGVEVAIEIELVPPTQPKITVNPSSGTVGLTIVISGTDYPENENIGNIVFGETVLSLKSARVGSIANDEVTTDSKGAFEVSAEVPKETPDSTFGTHSIATSVVEDEIPADFQITGKITNINPTSASVGDSITVKGNGYGETEKVRIDFGNTNGIVTANADEYGEFEATFIVNDQVYNPDGRTVTATGLTSGQEQEAPQSVIVAPKITEVRREGTDETDFIVGETGTLKGSGFADGESITIKIAGKSAEVTEGKSVLEKGIVEASFVVTDGEYPESPVTVSVETDSTSATLQDAITITPRVIIQSVTVSPKEAGLGDTIQVKANGTPDAEASFSISDVPLATNKEMSEERAGSYIGEYTVQEGDDVQNATVKVMLKKGERNVAVDESQYVSIDTTPVPDFSVQCVQSEQTAKISKSTAYIINVIGKSGFEGTVELETKDLPKDFEAVFSPDKITLSKEQSSGTSQLTINIPDEASAKNYDFSVRGLVSATGVFRELTGLKLKVEKLTSKITVLLDPSKPSWGRTVKVHGNVILDLSEPDEKRTDLNILLSYNLLPDGEEKTVTTQTDKQRNYSENISFDQPGKWQITAFWDGDNKYQPVETSPHEFDVTKRIDSNIEWLKPPVSVKKGEATNLSFQLTPNLKDEKIRLKITHIDEDTKEKTEDTEELTTGELGIVSYDFPAEIVGEWLFQADWEGNQKYEPCSSDQLSVIVEGNPGKAILVLGGNPQSSAFWRLNKNMIKRIEDTFVHRNFKVEDIAYLDFEENSPNLPFEETLSLKKRFELAVTDWAKGLVSPSAPLYIYVIGHGRSQKGVVLAQKSILIAFHKTFYLTL